MTSLVHGGMRVSRGITALYRLELDHAARALLGYNQRTDRLMIDKARSGVLVFGRASCAPGGEVK